MKEKILASLIVGFLEVTVLTASATAGSLFARCIELKIQENLARKNQKQARTAD